MQVANLPASTFGGLAVGEYTSTLGWDASRVETTGTGGSATDNQTTAITSNMTSAGAGLFFGGVTITGSAAGTTQTPDSPFTNIATQSDNSTHQAGSVASHIYASGTTDAVGWTIAGVGNRGWAAGGLVYKELAAVAAILMGQACL
jgi:hypothetical protein